MNERALESLAVAGAAFFSGAAMYITLAEQPARLLLDNRNLLLEWQTSYPVGLRMQGSVVILAGFAAIWAWWLSRDWRWILGATLILANWPFTLLALQPVNATLMAISLDQPAAESRALMQQWGNLHAIRSGLGMFAMVTFLWALIPRRS
jgi:Anthrone oxygenase